MEGWITWEELSHEWGCRVGELPSPYLGLPLDAPFKSMAVWDEIEVLFYKRLLIWKDNISLKGKAYFDLEQIIQLAHIFISLFSISREVKLRLEKIQRDLDSMW